MRTLYLLFNRFGAFFLFLLLEAIAFFLIVNFNENQRLILISSANRITGNAYQQISDVQDYFNLTNLADSLADENARLRTRLENLESNQVLEQDSVRDDKFNQYYEYVAAKVINKSVHQHNNSFTLNRGGNSGIVANTGVISDKGVVGIVRKVSKHFAQVMPILHREAKISASVQSTGFFGSLVWRGRDPRYMRLQDIPKYALVEKGDTVQTTGFSSMFPTGITIGLVDTAWSEASSNFHEIRVELIENLVNTEYVYVVNNLRKEEQDKLEATTTNE